MPHGRISLYAEVDIGQVSGNFPLLYQVSREDSSGLMAVIGTVMTQLGVAEWLGAEPVVDLRKYAPYREEKPVNGTENVWEYYFDQVGTYTTRDLDGGQFRILRSVVEHPLLKGQNRNLWYQTQWNRYVKFNQSTEKHISEQLSALGVGNRDVGLHVRSGDMNGFPRHPFPATMDQLIAATRFVLDSGDFDGIYVASQRENDMKALKKEFGHRLKIPNAFRYSDGLSRKATPFSGRTSSTVGIFAERIRRNHRYLLGLEVLQDVVGLARCGALVCGPSNVSHWAQILTSDENRPQVIIQNGYNDVNNRYLAKANWWLRSLLPAKNSSPYPRRFRIR